MYMYVIWWDMLTGRMGNIKEALKLITEQLQDVDKVVI